MELSSADIGRLADLGRRLAKASAIDTTVAQVFDALRAVCRIKEVRIVYSGTPAMWTEWIAASRSLKVVNYDELPRPRTGGVVEFFDKDNPGAGFVWAKPNVAKIAQTFELVAPQIWAGMLLHTARERAKWLHISEHSMARESMRARDEERRRIARDLHDDLGQSLASLKLKLKWVEDSLQNGNAPDAAVAELKTAREDVGEMFTKIRDLSHTLHPQILDTLGLSAAVKELAHQVARFSNLRIACSVKGTEQSLTEERGVALYRCCQEAISNALKHAEATKVTVEMEFHANSIRIAVEDNGKGFDPQSLYRADARSTNIGFWTIRQRISSMGGTFRLSTARGKGTVVEMIMPLRLRKMDAKGKNKVTHRR